MWIWNQNFFFFDIKPINQSTTGLWIVWRGTIYQKEQKNQGEWAFAVCDDNGTRQRIGYLSCAVTMAYDKGSLPCAFTWHMVKDWSLPYASPVRHTAKGLTTSTWPSGLLFFAVGVRQKAQAKNWLCRVQQSCCGGARLDGCYNQSRSSRRSRPSMPLSPIIPHRFLLL